jgi:hypothetical protein
VPRLESIIRSWEEVKVVRLLKSQDKCKGSGSGSPGDPHEATTQHGNYVCILPLEVTVLSKPP